MRVGTVTGLALGLLALWGLVRGPEPRAEESEDLLGLARRVAVDLAFGPSRHDRCLLRRFQTRAAVPASGFYDAHTRAALVVYGVPDDALPPPFVGVDERVDYYTGAPAPASRYAPVPLYPEPVPSWTERLTRPRAYAPDDVPGAPAVFTREGLAAASDVDLAGLLAGGLITEADFYRAYADRGSAPPATAPIGPSGFVPYAPPIVAPPSAPPVEARPTPAPLDAASVFEPAEGASPAQASRPGGVAAETSPSVQSARSTRVPFTATPEGRLP